MESALDLHRLQFAFTISYHYLFPQLTMGLALIVFILKTVAWRTGRAFYEDASHFWGKILALNFGMGVVTGIPMEFQFGTNWSAFSSSTGSIVGQTLAMEGVFSFFLESTFLGLFLAGRSRLGPGLHWLSSLCVFVGSWLSGYFILATNAWMQHPVGFERAADGTFVLTEVSALFRNPWLFWQYPHNMLASVVTASGVVAAVGAYYLLSGKHEAFGKFFVKIGVVGGVISSVLVAFPTGDGQAQNVNEHQPEAFAAMEGLFYSEEGAPLVLIGQPDVEARRLDNPIHVPKLLSFLTYQRWDAEVRGLDEFPEDRWPTNIPLLYFSYHIMAGLGTIFIGVFTLCAVGLWKGRLFRTPPLLWALMLMVPFPYIANTAGWMTAEMGRQPWLVYGLMRTAEGASPQVGAGNALFTLLGFLGLYSLLTILFLFLSAREINHGPEKGASEVAHAYAQS